MEYELLYDLRVEDYEFPGEKNAFALLKKVPVLDQLIGVYLNYMDQIMVVPEAQGDYYRVTKETCPEIYRIYQTALNRLCIAEEYPLFIKADFEYNAYVIGGKSPYVVIHSSIVKNMTDGELLFVLGHELGHVKSGHLIYSMMADQLETLLANSPALGSLVLSTGLHYLLMDWKRMHEFTADRAGVIAAGDIECSIETLGKFLGTSENIPEVHFSVKDLMKQNDTFEAYNQDILGKLFCAYQIMESTHPWTVSRIKELDRWKQSGQYEAFLGKYGVHI